MWVYKLNYIIFSRSTLLNNVLKYIFIIVVAAVCMGRDDWSDRSLALHSTYIKCIIEKIFSLYFTASKYIYIHNIIIYIYFIIYLRAMNFFFLFFMQFTTIFFTFSMLCLMHLLKNKTTTTIETINYEIKPVISQIIFQ